MERAVSEKKNERISLKHMYMYIYGLALELCCICSFSTREFVTLLLEQFQTDIILTATSGLPLGIDEVPLCGIGSHTVRRNSAPIMHDAPGRAIAPLWIV